MKYVVGHISFFDNELLLEQVDAKDEHEAFWKHSQLQSPDWDGCINDTIGMNAQELADWSFDFDIMVSILELE